MARSYDSCLVCTVHAHDAKTGEEGLTKMREFRPDLVLLDINMPGVGGLAACREIRADPNVAIIMLTICAIHFYVVIFQPSLLRRFRVSWGRFGGGVPVKVGKTVVGALGASGGTVDQDVQVANAALAAFGTKK